MIHAGPLHHRKLSCWGYVVREKQPPVAGARPRKAVVLGDTSDSSLLRDEATGADVIVHEATFAETEVRSGTNSIRGAKADGLCALAHFSLCPSLLSL